MHIINARHMDNIKLIMNIYSDAFWIQATANSTS